MVERAFLLLALFSLKAVQPALVYVDPLSGSDLDCLSLQELRQGESFNDTAAEALGVPCRTVNRALGYEECGNKECHNANPLSNSVVRLSNGVHTLEECIAVVRGTNITIEAENIGQATIRCAQLSSMRANAFDNMESCFTEGLTFRGIVFEGCGPSHPNVFINRSTDVLFEDCTFRDNFGPPLQVQFVPSIRLVRTHFLRNHNQKPAPLDSEDTTIDDVFRSIRTGGGFTYFTQHTDVFIVVDQCSFINNTGNSIVDGARPIDLSANGHGGGILLRMGSVTGARIEITDSTFEGNEAEVDGGAIYFAVARGNLSSSHVFISNTSFTRNSAVKSHGGAISWSSYEITYNNTIILEDCEFSNNSASSCGAMSIINYESNADSFLYPDRVEFVRCEFTENRAKVEGTAVGLFGLIHVEEFGYPVHFINCSFIRNVFEDFFFTPDGNSNRSSALLAFRFPVMLNGSNYFLFNQGGGIMLVNARLQVKGRLLIALNAAIFGGGIAMEDSCLMEVHPGTSITLRGNLAHQSGGGIYVNTPTVRHSENFFNRLCFFQYASPTGHDTPPSEWQDVHVNFIGNGAYQSGAAIHASNLDGCNWIGSQYPRNYTIFGDQPEEIQDRSPFYYRDNFVTRNGSQKNTDISTGPSKIFATIPETRSTVVQPGETVTLEILVVDEFGNSREAVWSLEAPNQNPMVGGISAGMTTSKYVIPAADDLLNRTCLNATKGNFTLSFFIPQTQNDVAATLTLEIDGCHPGYVMDLDSCLCMCDTSAAVRCDSQSSYIYLEEGRWGGMDSSRKLVTSYAFGGYLNCEREGRLSGCLYQWNNESAQCREGRHGPLCGTCDDGYALSPDLQLCFRLLTDNCRLGFAMFILICMFAVVLFFLVLFFNIGLPNELRGLLLYMQVVGIIYRNYVIFSPSPATSYVGVDPLGFMTNIFGVALPIPFCISPSLQAQHTALLGYLFPSLIAIIVGLYVLSIRFIKPLSNRSALKGFTLLFLLFYKYVGDTSSTLVSCTITTNNEWVFIYNGAIKCNSVEFIFFYLIAVTLISTFMIFTPPVVGYICAKRPVKFQQYADVLTEGLRPKHRWFGGWDIGRRFLFIVLGASIPPQYALLHMSVTATTVLIVHLLVQPYEKRHVNIIESLVLMNLVVVSILYVEQFRSKVGFWFSTTLLMAPFVYGLLYLAWVVFDKCFCKKYREKHKDDPNSFLNKERSIVFNRKKLSIGSVRKVSLGVSTLADEKDLGEWQAKIQRSVPRRREACGNHQKFAQFRESVFNDL